VSIWAALGSKEPSAKAFTRRLPKVTQFNPQNPWSSPYYSQCPVMVLLHSDRLTRKTMTSTSDSFGSSEHNSEDQRKRIEHYATVLREYAKW